MPLTLPLPCAAFQEAQMTSSVKLAVCSHFLPGANLGRLFCARGVLCSAEWKKVAFKIRRKVGSWGVHLPFCGIGSGLLASSRLTYVWCVPYVLLYCLSMWVRSTWALPESELFHLESFLKNFKYKGKWTELIGAEVETPPCLSVTFSGWLWWQ